MKPSAIRALALLTVGIGAAGSLLGCSDDTTDAASCTSACPDSGSEAGSPPDATSSQDASPDAARGDAGSNALVDGGSDAGEVDAGEVDAGEVGVGEDGGGGGDATEPDASPSCAPVAHMPTQAPGVIIDPNATLKEIVISGRGSTYSQGAPTGNYSVTLEDVGIYSDGSVRGIENLPVNSNYVSLVVWTSSDTNIAIVLSGDSRTAGAIQGVHPGTVTITATYLGVSKSVCFTVTPPVVADVTVSPGLDASFGSPTLAKPGDVIAFTCQERLTDGTTLDATAMVTWASSAPSVATVSSTGSVHALAGGTTSITATLPASVAVVPGVQSLGSATFDVIGTTGLAQGAMCSGGSCAAGLSCCPIGHGAAPTECTPTIAPSSPCPMFP